jgi:hypothetical protein
VAACGVAVLTLVSGCSGHSRPTAVPVSSVASSSRPQGPAPSKNSVPAVESANPAPVSSASVATSAAASTDPSAEVQKAAAVGVVQAFFAGVNHQTDTGDQAAVIATFTTKCNLCVQEVGSIADQLTGGRTIRGTAYRTLAVNQVWQSAPRIVTVEITVMEAAGELLDARGKVLRTFAATAPARLVFQVALDVAPPTIFQVDLTQ